jgi:hypothetical protein
MSSTMPQLYIALPVNASGKRAGSRLKHASILLASDQLMTPAGSAFFAEAV